MISMNVLAGELFKYFKQMVFVVLGLRRLAPSILCPDTVEQLIYITKEVRNSLRNVTKEETIRRADLDQHNEILQDALRKLDKLKAINRVPSSHRR
jgi:hypothetical protein